MGSEVPVKTCPACDGTGWIVYKAYANSGATPCLDEECLANNGMVPEDYTPVQPAHQKIVRSLGPGQR